MSWVKRRWVPYALLVAALVASASVLMFERWNKSDAHKSDAHKVEAADVAMPEPKLRLIAPKPANPANPTSSVAPAASITPAQQREEAQREYAAERAKRHAELDAQFANVSQAALLAAILQHMRGNRLADFPYHDYSEALFRRLENHSQALRALEQQGDADARWLIMGLLLGCLRTPDASAFCSSEPLPQTQREFTEMTVRAIDEGDFLISHMSLSIGGYAVRYDDYQTRSRFVEQTRPALLRRVEQGDCVALDFLANSYSGMNGAIDLADPQRSYRYRYAYMIAPHASQNLHFRQSLQRTLNAFQSSLRPELLRAQEAEAKMLVQRSFQNDTAACKLQRNG